MGRILNTTDPRLLEYINKLVTIEFSAGKLIIEDLELHHLYIVSTESGSYKCSYMAKLNNTFIPLEVEYTNANMAV